MKSRGAPSSLSSPKEAHLTTKLRKMRCSPCWGQSCSTPRRRLTQRRRSSGSGWLWCSAAACCLGGPCVPFSSIDGALLGGEAVASCTRASFFIDLLMGLFRGAVFRDGRGARKQPIKQPTEMPTSTMALMGRFPSLMGRFLTLMGRFPDFVPRGRFPSRKSPGKQPVKKRGIKRFLISVEDRRQLRTRQPQNEPGLAFHHGAPQHSMAMRGIPQLSANFPFHLLELIESL